MIKTLPGGYVAHRCGNPGALRWELRDPENRFVGNFASMPQVREKVRELSTPLRVKLCAPVDVKQAGDLAGRAA